MLALSLMLRKASQAKLFETRLHQWHHWRQRWNNDVLPVLSFPDVWGRGGWRNHTVGAGSNTEDGVRRDSSQRVPSVQCHWCCRYGEDHIWWANRISHLNFRADGGWRSLSLPWYFRAFSNVFAVSGALLWLFRRKVQKFSGAELRFCWGLPVCRKPKPPKWNLPPSWNKDQPVFPEPAPHCHP